MSIRTFAIAIVGISAVGFLWLRPQQPAPVVNVSSAPPVTQTSRQDGAGARTYSSKQPLLVAGESGGLRDLPPSDAPAKPAAAGTSAPKVAIKDDPVVRPVASGTSTKRISSTKPGDAEAREQLVRDIQYELRRAGCYEGEVHGAWNNTTRNAMQMFTQRMNAALPVDQPDYVLLALLQAQKAQSCKSGCPAGQIVDRGGRCLPKAIVAQQQGGSLVVTSGQTSTLSNSQDPPPGRMSAGASMVGQDLPAAPQAQDGVVSDGSQPYARPNADHARRQRPRPSTYARRGSTRQVFTNMMLSAP